MQVEREYIKDQVNIELLAQTLRDTFPGECAGCKVIGKRVYVIFDVKPSDEMLAQTQALIDAHDPTAKTEEQAQEEMINETLTRARVKAKSIPAWATMGEDEAIAFIQNNVTDLGSAKTVLIAMARIIVHLRDAQWPDL